MSYLSTYSSVASGSMIFHFVVCFTLRTRILGHSRTYSKTLAKQAPDPCQTGLGQTARAAGTVYAGMGGTSDTQATAALPVLAHDLSSAI